MASTPAPIVFLVQGIDDAQTGATRADTRDNIAAPTSSEFPGATVKRSITLGVRRDAGEDVRVEAIPGEDVVVLEFANGPVLTLHPENARDLMLAQSDVQKAKRDADVAALGKDEVRVPANLQWRGLEKDVLSRSGTRGFLGTVLLKAFKVLTGVAKEKVADWAASKVVQRVDAQVSPGVYRLNPGALPRLKDTATPLDEIAPPAPGAPVLVLIHGTFSNTSGTFQKFWIEHPQRVSDLFASYKQAVYALDHPTLGTSPIGNALALVRALRAGTRLHLLTHSRGGLVAEVLARACHTGVGANDLDYFKGADYETQRDELKTLGQLVKEKNITVTRLVRVACPARGTLLASKRLDAYISVFKWTLQLAGLEILEEIVDFLGAVAEQRADPAKIPGLAAQIPDSPLVKWLHSGNDPIAGELRVIAGDLEGDSLKSWIKTLLADAYYWTDNDLVVQTRSMYGGVPRTEGATFVFDQGGKVSHFNYFSNELTAQAIASALTQDKPQAFRVIGPLSWKGEWTTGDRGRVPTAADPVTERKKPALFLLPGILGSNLKVDNKRIWLGLRLFAGLTRLSYKPNKRDGVEADGPVGLVYDHLVQFLSETHQVFEYGFDWRRPIEEEAKELGKAVQAALDARKESKQPVRILAHSMGGLLARTMQITCPDTWNQMMAHPDARLLMLGTPNAGSWAPMQVLSGDDTFGNALVAIGAPFQDHEARKMMATFPGFLQLQAALLDDRKNLHLEGTWADLAAQDLQRVQEFNYWHALLIQSNVYCWGAPPQAVLDQAVALRKALDAQEQNDLPKFADKLLLVIGRSDFTPDGYEITDEGLSYVDAVEQGDGRVTVQSALLPGVATWKLDCEHGKLPDKESAFDAYLDLLTNGKTTRLERYIAPVRRGTDVEEARQPTARRHSRPSRTRSGVPPQTPREVLSTIGRDTQPTAVTTSAALPITVVNGNLKFVRQPLLIGHYRSLALTGTEWVMDDLIGGSMTQALQLGQYPEWAGASAIFINRRTNDLFPLLPPRPQAVIVAGLGEEGKLTPIELVRTVRSGVISWVQRLADSNEALPTQFEIAATLIGSGGTGISPGRSAQLIAQGVREANERLTANSLPSVGQLHLIEVFLDRATEAWRALQTQADAAPGFYTVAATIKAGAGAMRRSLDENYRGADYDFITAVTRYTKQGSTEIAYTLDMKRARTEVRAQAMQGPLLRELVAGAARISNNDSQIGRTLFQLLVPLEMEPFLTGGNDVVLELDSNTASVPWEVLDTPPDLRGGGDRRPWAIRSKLLRKLRTEVFREHVADANADAHVLVIGEPNCGPKYPRLAGARAEARSVRLCLASENGLQTDRIKALIAGDGANDFGPDARQVLDALAERSWRIVHIAGHGAPPEMSGEPPRKPGDPPQQLVDPRGVVLSGDTYLGPREIQSMRIVPELVFVNCCHLGAQDPSGLVGGGTAVQTNAAGFAAGVAEELIRIGVRCVIAAGWAVDDEAAQVFAVRFYSSLLARSRFIDAVAEAREAASQLGGNTWAAYQCYGDPDWRFRRGIGDAQRPAAPPPPGREFAGIAAPPGLTLALENLAIDARFNVTGNEDKQKEKRAEIRSKIAYLEKRFGALWGEMGAVAEAFGVAYAGLGDAGLGDRDKAIEWYEKAAAAADSSATIKVREQLSNLRARVAWETAKRELDAMSSATGSRATVTGKAGNARGGAAKGKVANADPIARALKEIEDQATHQPTVENLSLWAAAWKRKSMIADARGENAAAAEAIGPVRLHYKEAEELARLHRTPDLFYPALNRMATDLILDGGRPDWRGFDEKFIAEIRAVIDAKNRDDPDFWSLAAETELGMYESLAKGELARALPGIRQAFEDLHRRERALWKWSSVCDQAQFVLPKYAARARDEEKQAAATLLEFVKGLAAR